MMPMVDMQPVFFNQPKRPAIRVSPRKIGWALLMAATVVLWAEVVAMTAADLLREPTFTYNSEVAAYVY